MRASLEATVAKQQASMERELAELRQSTARGTLGGSDAIERLRQELRQTKESHEAALRKEAEEFRREVTSTTAELRQELARLAEQVERPPKMAEEALSGLERLQEELGSLKDLAVRSRQMQQDFTETKSSIDQELDRLSEYMVGCLSRVENLPGDVEHLREQVKALQESHAIRNAAVDATLSGGAGLDGASGQGELTQALVAVTEEIMKMKALFRSGQKSAGIVMSDVEIVRQDVKAISQSVQQLRGGA